MKGGNLTSGNLFWSAQNGPLAHYPKLDQAIDCDVAIIGGGITGAMIGYYFAKAKIDTVVIEKNEPASGATTASTALLLYELDTHLTDLIDLLGLDRAVQAYKVCFDALSQLNNVIHDVGDHCDYRHKKSLYLASNNKDAKKLEKEYEARRKNGFNVEFLTSADLGGQFDIDRPAALLTEGAAEVDPYLLTFQLLSEAKKYGLRIFSHTAVKSFENINSGVILKTDNNKISAKKVIFATGYESQEFIKEKVVDLHISFAFASQKLDSNLWFNDYLIWETSRPYLYLRTSSDQRILVGGEDISMANLTDKLIHQKSKKLAEKSNKLLKNIELKPEFFWAGIFGTTKDGLPYIGENKEFPNAYFALSYDANGMVYSVIASELLLDLYSGRKNPNAELFRFGR